jgi:hypothetical protein
MEVTVKSLGAQMAPWLSLNQIILKVSQLKKKLNIFYYNIFCGD